MQGPKTSCRRDLGRNGGRNGAAHSRCLQPCVLQLARLLDLVPVLDIEIVDLFHGIIYQKVRT